MVSAEEEAEVEFNYVIIEYLHGSHHPLHSTRLHSALTEGGAMDGWQSWAFACQESFFDEPDDESLADGEVPRNMSFYGSLLEINLYTRVQEGEKTGLR